MESLKLLFQIYLRPAFAFSEIMDRGNWLVAAGLTLLVGVLFFGTINAKLEAAYRIPLASDYIDPSAYDPNSDAANAETQQRWMDAYQSALATRKSVPIAGDNFFNFQVIRYRLKKITL